MKSIAASCPLTALQFALLRILETATCAVPSAHIRSQLWSKATSSNQVSFVHLAQLLESKGYIEGMYTQKESGKQTVTERRYRLLKAGRVALKQTREFYAG